MKVIYYEQSLIIYIKFFIQSYTRSLNYIWNIKLWKIQTILAISFIFNKIYVQINL